MSPDVLLIDTGLANLASLEAAFGRLGASVARTTDPARVAQAERVILPGVGAFGAGMARLKEAGLVSVLRQRIGQGRATLAVCLGLQLLTEGSEESPGVAGLGLIPAQVTRFPATVETPQMAWNAVSVEGGRLLQGGAAYFANSYRIAAPPSGWGVARADHGGPFVAALERGRVLACQFHPELSGAWGQSLLQRWLTDTAAPARPPGRVGPRIVPCLDVRGGRVVKGVRFQGLRDAGDPVARARAYAEQGADELVVLDVSATAEERGAALETVAAVRQALDLPLTVGGGLRSVDAAARLLSAGADKVALNTAAFLQPDLINQLADRFGRQCVVVAVDAARRGEGWELVIRAGTERTGRDAVSWCAEVAARGAGELLVTSWDRDGTGDGYDLPLLRAIAERVSVPVIASGGAAGPVDLARALRAGASAVLAASIFHDGVYTVGAVKSALAEAGIEVRR